MWNYSEKVIDHFLHPRNVGEIEKADGMGEVGSLACGDMLRLTFKLDSKGRIIDAKFKTFGCASAIASSSALTEMIKGKTIEEAEKITNKDIADYLGGLPDEKMHCSVMGREALLAAIEKYRGKPVHKHELEGEVICKCFGITEPQIRKAIDENGLETIEEVMNYTKAGGACGECHEKIQHLLDLILAHKSSDAEKKTPLNNLQKIRLIEELIETRIRPALKQDGGDIELIDVDKNTVTVKLKGACASCPVSDRTMKQFVEKELQKEIMPEIHVEERH